MYLTSPNTLDIASLIIPTRELFYVGLLFLLTLSPFPLVIDAVLTGTRKYEHTEHSSSVTNTAYSPHYPDPDRETGFRS